MKYDERIELIKEIVKKHQPDLIHLLNKPGKLNDKEIELLDNILLKELIETGLNDDDEPNQRGIIIEELIDLLHPIK